MNRYLIDGWIAAPKRRRRITGTYYQLQVDADTADEARAVVRLAYPGIEFRKVELDLVLGTRVKVLSISSTED